MEHTFPPQTIHWSLERLIAHLSQQPAITGLLAIGSLVHSEVSPHSDYDLVLVAETIPVPWCTGVTQIEGRLADLIFVSTSEVEKITALNAPVPPSHPLAPVIRWLEQGKILFDRSGSMQKIQRKLREGVVVQPDDAAAAYNAWHAINFNLAHALRMSASDDPLYQAALSTRMAVYGHADLWFGYFTIRSIPWQGDKDAIKYLSSKDPQYLDVYQKFLHENDRLQKLEYYQQAAALAAEPLGGLWPAEITVMNTPAMLLIWQAWMQSVSSTS
jgi:hypothetical protein